MARTREAITERWQCDRCQAFEEPDPLPAGKVIPGMSQPQPRLQRVWVSVEFRAIANVAGIPVPHPVLFCLPCACAVAGVDAPDVGEWRASTLGAGLGTCGHCHHALALHKAEPRADRIGMEITCGSPACQCRFPSPGRDPRAEGTN